jgi:DNA-directed RNA polymerase subunit RPC12/RpoP
MRWKQKTLQEAYQSGHKYWDDLPISKQKCLGCGKEYIDIGLVIIPMCDECNNKILSKESKWDLACLEAKLTLNQKRKNE